MINNTDCKLKQDDTKRISIINKPQNPRNSIIMVSVLVIILIFIGITFHNLNYSAKPEIIPTIAPAKTTGEVCPVNTRRYSVAEALYDPGNACSVYVLDAKELDRLTSSKILFNKVKLLMIQNVLSTQIPAAIGNFSSLVELRIDGIEGQSDLPREIGKLSNLTKLWLDDTELEKLPPEIAYLKQLKSLYIVWNADLAIIPFSVSKLTRLEDITVRYNPNVKIPDSLVSIRSLKNINITGQNITKIPNGVYEIPALRWLIYSDNQIATISADIARLSSLELLALDRNRIDSIPEIGTLVNLTELRLNNNNLTQLPEGIGKLIKLQNLNLSHNVIDDSTTDKFQLLTELISLDLGDNKLTKLPSGIEKLKKLQYLRLKGNAIDRNTVENLRKYLPQTNIAF